VRRRCGQEFRNSLGTAPPPGIRGQKWKRGRANAAPLVETHFFVYAATFFFVAVFFAAGLMEVGAILGFFSFLGWGGTKTASASVRKSNSPSRGMPLYPVSANRRAKPVSVIAVVELRYPNSLETVRATYPKRELLLGQSRKVR
jgi:hypothetical protein